MFDLGFLYVNDIWPKHLWDGMLAEKLIFLGYPPALSLYLYDKLQLPEYTPVTDPNTGETRYYEISYSLKAAAMRRCGINVDKTVRGKIIDEGLTEEVIVYAAGDVMWLEDIKAEQDKELDRQDLQRAMAFECEFIKPLAYAKHCGVHLDVNKWTSKMNSDIARLKNAEKALNSWVIEWEKNKQSSVVAGNDVEYVDPNLDPKSDERWLLEHGYVRYPLGDKPNPTFPGNKLHAYKRKPNKSKYTVKDVQGDLFEGFSTEPKCIVNWNSSKQVIPLFEELGIQVKTFDKKTKKEKKSVEEKLLAPQANDFSIIPLYLDYQGASKVVTTYGDNWLKAVNPKTGRIHVELHSIGTDTARVSSGGGVYKLNLLILEAQQCELL